MEMSRYFQPQPALNQQAKWSCKPKTELQIISRAEDSQVIIHGAIRSGGIKQRAVQRGGGLGGRSCSVVTIHMLTSDSGIRVFFLKASEPGGFKENHMKFITFFCWLEISERKLHDAPSARPPCSHFYPCQRKTLSQWICPCPNRV